MAFSYEEDNSRILGLKSSKNWKTEILFLLEKFSRTGLKFFQIDFLAGSVRLVPSGLKSEKIGVTRKKKSFLPFSYEIYNRVVEQAKKIGGFGVFYDHRKIDFTIDRKIPPRKLSIVKSILRSIWAPKMKNLTHFSFFFQKILGHRLEKCKKKQALDPKIRFAPPL